MKTLRWVTALAMGLVLVSPNAFAACKDGFVLKRVGEVKSASAVISTQGHDIDALMLKCGATSCIAGLNDTDTVAGAEDSNVVLEPGAAANTGLFLDLTESPIYFSDGITFIDDSNVTSLTVYSCQPK